MNIAAFFTRKIVFTLLAVLAFGIFTGAGVGESFLFGLLVLGLSFGLNLAVLLLGIIVAGTWGMVVVAKRLRSGVRVV